jgi:hypothetical protein
MLGVGRGVRHVGLMAKWEVRVQVHGPHRSTTTFQWQGDADDRGEAIYRALDYAEQQLGRPLDPKVRVTLHVASA